MTAATCWQQHRTVAKRGLHEDHMEAGSRRRSAPAKYPAGSCRRIDRSIPELQRFRYLGSGVLRLPPGRLYRRVPTAAWRGFQPQRDPTPDSDLGGQADLRIVDGLTG